MTPNVQLEVERKYEVPADGAAPDWGTLPTLTVEPEAQGRDLEAVYFDTPDDRLAGFGVALRRRTGGPDAGWHLKYRDELGKHELHVPLLKTSDRLPAQMKQYIAGMLAGQEVAPLATVRNNRQVLDAVHPEFGKVAEICIDDVHAIAERTGVQRTWSEYEVELVNGTGADGAAVFDEIESAVLAAGLTPSASAAKIARALGADDAAGTVTVTEPVSSGQDEESAKDRKDSKKATKKAARKSAKKPGRKTTEKAAKKAKAAESSAQAEVAGTEVEAAASAAGQVWELANASVHQLIHADFLLRIGDPEGVHAVRVAARRLIAVILGVGEELATTGHDDLAQRLQGLSDRLSTARDAEVVAGLLPERAAVVGEPVSGVGLAQLKALAEEQRESTRAAAVRHLNTKPHLQLLTDLHSWADGLELSEQARDVTPKKLATRAVKRWTQALGEAEKDLDLEAEATSVKTSPAVDQVHVHRKALRNLRYGLDGLADTTGLEPKKSWRGVLDGTQEIQAGLSDMMDSAVMDDWFTTAARLLARTGGDRYVVGLLHGLERARLRSFEDRAPGMIDRLLSEVSPKS